jgi:aminoglycoside phosphotransferase (APT) family kinase protein
MPVVPVMPVTAERVYGEIAESVRTRVVSTGGFHNRNYRVVLTERQALPLGLATGASVLVRVRRSGRELVRRTWSDEDAVLTALAARPVQETARETAGFPRVLHTSPGGSPSVISYAEGTTVAEAFPAGAHLSGRVIGQIAEFFAWLTAFEEKDLPSLPERWAEPEDSTGFMHGLVDYAQDRLADGHRAAFGRLFDGLGIADDAMRRFGRALRPLQRRPFALLHTDVHRNNLVIDRHGRLQVIDWEHASFGDPVYDLATHLCRTRYPADQEQWMIDSWERAVRAVSPRHAEGLRQDLPRYLAYERAQSIYPDVIRAALSLGAVVEDSTLAAAVRRTRAALVTAAEPLGLGTPPDDSVIRRLLLDWLHDSRGGPDPISAGRRRDRAATEPGWWAR